MPRPSAWDDDDDDRDWSPDDAEEETLDVDDDSEPTFPCPSCRRLIYEEADACPYCGEYLSLGDRYGGQARPWWVLVGAIVALVAMLAGVVVTLIALLAS